ncbi:MAG: PA2169 family four-helix-bundle protein [Parasphingopyxis sp.]|nr:PA2169 family four-helix-bundle protein [Sphingomonadales bacterium]
MTNGLTTLQTLTDTTIDSAIGYEKAAESAESPTLKETLGKQAMQRRKLVDELNNEIVRLGGEARESQSFSGSVHHVWTKISTMFGDADASAAERVEEGEDYIEKKFREALENKEFEPRTQQLLQRAHGEIAEGERLTDALEAQYD